MAMAVLSLTSWPNLKEACLLSLRKIKGTFLEEAKLGRCFVSHLGLLSEAISTAYNIVINVIIISKWRRKGKHKRKFIVNENMMDLKLSGLRSGWSHTFKDASDFIDPNWELLLQNTKSYSSYVFIRIHYSPKWIILLKKNNLPWTISFQVKHSHQQVLSTLSLCTLSWIKEKNIWKKHMGQQFT